MAITRWMSWEAGVTLFARTRDDLEMPNVIIHVAGIVQTPKGESPAGMILWQPDPDEDPILAGFITEVKKVGRYFGPKIYQGTPFEELPVAPAEVDVEYKAKRGRVICSIFIDEWDFEIRFSDLGPAELVNRPPTPETPFYQQGLEITPGKVQLLVNGKKVPITVAKRNIAGGPGAVFSPFGLYAREEPKAELVVEAEPSAEVEPSAELSGDKE